MHALQTAVKPDALQTFILDSRSIRFRINTLRPLFAFTRLEVINLVCDLDFSLADYGEIIQA